MTKPHKPDCPVAAMLNIFGDRWTLLVIREAFYGAARFSEFERNTGIAKNLLADRLALLTCEGILEKQDVGQSGTRYAYHLTDKGRALQPVLIAMVQWGNAHCYKDGNGPIEIIERASGLPIAPLQPSAQDGAILEAADMKVIPGPGATKRTHARLAEAYKTQTKETP